MRRSYIPAAPLVGRRREAAGWRKSILEFGNHEREGRSVRLGYTDPMGAQLHRRARECVDQIGDSPSLQ
jgi:hypothetical protein